MYVGRSLPMMNEFHRYKECIELGSTPLSEVEVAAVIQGMLPEWGGRDYSLTKKNCCHYSTELAKRLKVGEVPAWVNKMARAGARLGLG